MASRLSEDLLARVQEVALLGPGRAVDFEFHLTDWLTDSARKSAHPVLPEVEKLKGTKVLCFYGREQYLIFAGKRAAKRGNVSKRL